MNDTERIEQIAINTTRLDNLDKIIPEIHATLLRIDEGQRKMLEAQIQSPHDLLSCATQLEDKLKKYMGDNYVSKETSKSEKRLYVAVMGAYCSVGIAAAWAINAFHLYPNWGS